MEVRARFEATGLGFIATLRKDGAPRICGIEPLFAQDELWLGMMFDSLKARDLLRDPRFSLHSATTDKQVTQGDARISGQALAIGGAAAIARFREAFEQATGTQIPDAPVQLFRAEIQELSMVRPAGEHLDVDSWREGSGLKHVARFM